MSDDVAPDEQRAFGQGHDLAVGLIEGEGLNPVYVGTGLLMAAVNCLGNYMPRSEIAEILQNYADDCRKNG